MDQVGELADRLGTSVPVLVGGTVALVVAVVLGILAWTRESPPPPEISIPYAAPAATTASAVTTEATVPLVVHVAGAVARPGVYSLATDARVGDVLTAAGGPADGADLDRLNLAAPVADGSRVYVPRVGEEAAPAVLGPDVSESGGSGSGGADGPVDINTADAARLEDLPGVGPATAAAIVAHREANGPFVVVDDLLDVRGIGEAKLAALRDLATV
ncbi:MAG: ComEA family DNA-binding protein [Acidimicrobiia bacterium]|nr:ComEA family DNA-binding protein [Acidimicrobiia bacterium]